MSESWNASLYRPENFIPALAISRDCFEDKIRESTIADNISALPKSFWIPFYFFCTLLFGRLLFGSWSYFTHNV